MTTPTSDPLAMSDIEVLRLVRDELLLPESHRDYVYTDHAVLLSCVEDRIAELTPQPKYTKDIYPRRMKENWLAAAPAAAPADLEALGERQLKRASELEAKHRAYLRGGPVPGEEEDPPTGGLSSPAENVVTAPAHREETR